MKSLCLFLKSIQLFRNIGCCIDEKLVLGYLFQINVVSDNPCQTSKLLYIRIRIFYSRGVIGIEKGLLKRLQNINVRNIKHLMTGPLGNSEFCFPRISMFPETKSGETLRFEGNKILCSLRDQSLSDLLYSKTKRKQILNNALRFQQQRSTFRG